MKVKIKITEVTDWYLDDAEFNGTASHIGEHDTLELQTDEENEKTESNKWNESNLPKIVEFNIHRDDFDDINIELSAVIEEKAISYINDKMCSYDIYKAERCEFEEV